MRIQRVPIGWEVLAPSWPCSVRLKEVADRCGYRVREICEELGCSEGYFRRVFLRDIGLSPKQWLRDERMLVAKQRLEEGRDLIEVAEALGFSCVGSFSREFRMVFCTPPGRWCRMRREEKK